MAGMRSSLVGTRASREAEPYCQDANVTDAARVRLKCRTRDTLIAWTSLIRWLRGRGTKQEDWILYPLPRNQKYRFWESGSLMGLTSQRASSKPGTPG